jgi:outer membrane cobalamin receptor
MKIKFIIIISLVLFAYNANSQNNDTLATEDLLESNIEQLLNVRVNVSSTIPTSIFETPSAVTIIDKQTINKYNFSSLAEAIRIVAGVEVLQTVLDRNVPTFRGILQNFYANKVLIMVNNIPVWQPTYGNGTLDRFSINDVERIEILKGPASVLYGTNAYNGVINIITVKPEKTTLSTRISGGYPNYGSTEVNYQYKEDDVTLQISGSSSYEDRNPYLVRGGADTLVLNEIIYHNNDTIYHETYLHENDTLYYYHENYRNYTFNISATYKSHNIYLNNFASSYNYMGANATYKSGANLPFKDKGTLISYTFDTYLNSKTHLVFNAHYDYFQRDYQFSHINPTSTNFSAYRIGSSIKLNYTFSELFKLEGGSDFTDGHNLGHYIRAVIPDTVISENIKNERDIIENSLFAQGMFNLNNFALLAGLRYTYNRSFGSDLSTRFTGLVRINSSNRVKLLFGQSYRTPNLLELYFNHASVIGNPNLKPEKAKTFELIYLSRINYFFGQFTAYYTHYNNLIQRIRTTTDINQPATYRNLGAFNGYGVEIEFKYHNPILFNSFVKYNYMDGNGTEAESNFKYVPNHYVSAGIYKSIGAVFISTNSYYYSETDGTWEQIPEQMMIDMHAGLQKNTNKGKIIHTLSLKNVTNSDMLIPEYIRNRPGVNVIPTTGFGRRIQYTLKVRF